MDMNRRSFLRGALAVSALSIAPAIASAPAVPKIVGDGIYDDTAGLEAALNRLPFECEGHVIADQGGLHFSNGAIFRTSRAVLVKKQEEIFVTGTVNILRDHGDHALAFEGFDRAYFDTVNIHTTERGLAELKDDAAAIMMLSCAGSMDMRCQGSGAKR